MTTADPYEHIIDDIGKAKGNGSADGSERKAAGNGAAGAHPGADMWSEPIDLFAEHLGVPAAIDEACLPATVLALARAEGARLGVDPVGIAATALAVCSAVISDDWRVRLKQLDSWTQEPRLWVAVVARPGEMKTDQIRAAKRPLDKIEMELRRQYEKDLAAYNEAFSAWESLPKKERQASEKPRAPVEPRITTQDATIEAISELLKGSSKIAVLLDELASFLGSFERYSGGKGGSGRSDALALYEGGPHRVDRVVRGAVFVENWSACVTGAIQVEKLRPMVKDLSADGLLQRFMVALPGQVTPANPDDDDQAPDRGAIDAYETLIRRLWMLRPPEREGGGCLEVRAGADAQPERLRLFRLIRRIIPDPTLPTALRETVSKWRGLLARLSLVFHCIAVAEGRSDTVTLSAGTVAMAANFIRRVVAPSTFRFYRELGLDGDPNARWVGGFILARKLEKLTAYEIGHAYRDLRGDLPAIVRTMDLLEHAGWVTGDNHPKRPVWRVNPLVHTLFAARADAEREQRAKNLELLKVRINELAT